MLTESGIIAAKGLGKRYDGRWIFRGVGFCLKPGERLIVTGRNGAGKSTLLRLLAGLEEPSEGEIGRLDSDLRLAMGYSAPEMRLYPWLTAREHLSLSAALRGIESDEGLLEFVDAAAYADVPCAKLSTGMRARVKLALAIQSAPKLLLLDEPGAGLDARGSELLDAVLQKQRLSGAAIIATNDPDERRFADLELVLD